ncbi:MAG: hypothetical protein HC869_00340 [Rhodospirillales bacterium]|nr:hypothetical protein [Rhodospirillales bacterium]
MDALTLILALLSGLIASLACGALSGVRVGGEALGTKLAAYIGGLYGLVAGTATTVIGVIAMTLIG